MSTNSDYHLKYLKYKNKYLDLKGGRGFRLSPSQQKELKKAEKENKKGTWLEQDAKKDAEKERKEKKKMEKKKKSYENAKKSFDKKVKDITSNPRGWKDQAEEERFKAAFEIIKKYKEIYEFEKPTKEEKEYNEVLEIVKKHSK